MLFERSELCSRPERSELIQLKCPSKRAQGAARSGGISIDKTQKTARKSFFKVEPHAAARRHHRKDEKVNKLMT